MTSIERPSEVPRNSRQTDGAFCEVKTRPTDSEDEVTEVSESENIAQLLHSAADRQSDDSKACDWAASGTVSPEMHITQAPTELAVNSVSAEISVPSVVHGTQYVVVDQTPSKESSQTSLRRSCSLTSVSHDRSSNLVPRPAQESTHLDLCERSGSDTIDQTAEVKSETSDALSSQLQTCESPSTPTRTETEQLNDSPESAGDDDTPKTPPSVSTIVQDQKPILAHASDCSAPHTPGKIQRLSLLFRRVFGRSMTS